jgi:surfeit locus 1 family protein
VKFKTHWALTVLLAALCALFVMLGNWQGQRAEEKALTQTQFDEAPLVTNLLTDAEDWSRARLYGMLDPNRHLLLDNKLYQGRAGVHVLTPLQAADGRTVLVNRGWLPLPPDRSRLPAIETPVVPIEITGRLGPLSQPGVQIGTPRTLQQDDWPQLIVYPEWERIETALGRQLHRQVLYLDVAGNAGFEDRNWTPFTMGPDRHQAYSVQWYGLAVTALVIWLVLGFSAGRRPAQ